MKNKFISFFLAALSIASAFASGTVTAPNGNVVLDTSGAFNYTIYLHANVTLDQSLSTSDSPLFDFLVLNSDLLGYGGNAFYSYQISSAHSTGGVYIGALGGSSAAVRLVAGSAGIIQFEQDTTGIIGYVDATGLHDMPVNATALKVGSSPVAISQIRMGSATFSSGIATISDSTVTLNTKVFLGLHYAGGVTYGEYFRTPGTSITIRSSLGTDFATFDYLLVEP